MTTYAIAGVTGHVGSAAAEALLASGAKVRVIVRDAAKGEPWKAKGAEVAVASLDDRAALTRAFEGVAGAFVLLPPNVASLTPIEDNAKRTAVIAEAVRAAKLPHVVLLSSVGAQHPDGTGPIQTVHHAERALAATGAKLAAVRAAYFQENWGASLGMLAQGVLPTFIRKDLSFAQVASKDIGKTVARALLEGTTGPIELAGPRDYTVEDIAAALSSITGKPVAVQEAPLDAVIPAFTGFGMSAPVAALYREMFGAFASGRVAPEPGQRTVRGTIEVRETLATLLA
jgi:uncharacterized protein YbjT (DUF2867 family)